MSIGESFLVDRKNTLAMQPDEQVDDGASMGEPTLGGTSASGGSRRGTVPETVEISVSLGSDAAHAYERILNSLEQRHGEDIDVDEHAEHVLRKYIANEYKQFILDGDPSADIQ